MKVLYDSVSSDYLHPLSQKDVDRVKKHTPSEIIQVIRQIRFGCNTKTTREGRMVKRGTCYDVEVNFCPRRAGKHFQSLVLSNRKPHLDKVIRYGGTPNLETGIVDWGLEGAKRYASYILLHEIGHVVYAEQGLLRATPDSNKRSTQSEEDWCDTYSARQIRDIGI